MKKSKASADRPGTDGPNGTEGRIGTEGPIATDARSASELISHKVAELGDWRGETLERMSRLIQDVDPNIVEEWKWRGTPVWSLDGIICTGEVYKAIVKLTFAHGAGLVDPGRLFNSSLDGNVRRAIDIHDGEVVEASAFQALVREAVALNTRRKAKPAKGPRKTAS